MKVSSQRNTKYKISDELTVTVSNKEAPQSDPMGGIIATVAIRVKLSGLVDPLEFTSNDKIAQFVQSLNFEDHQLSLINNSKQ